MKKLFNRNYLLILQGNAVSAFGDLLYSVAIGYWVYEQTGSSALMGVMSSIVLFVMMLVSPFSGSVIDRSDRKWVIVLMDVFRGVLMLLAGALAFSDRLTVPAVLAVAFFSALCSVFFSPAVSTALVDVIPRDEIVRGQSIHSGLTSLINLVGKAFSGSLVIFFGVAPIIVFNGISYLLSALTELFIRLPRKQTAGERVTVRAVLGNMATGLRAVWENPFLRIFVPTVMVLNLLAAGPMSLMLPFVLEKGFTVEQYGYLMSLTAGGSLACVAALSVFKLSKHQQYLAMGLGFLGAFVCYILSYSTRSFPVLCLFTLVGTLLNTLGNAVFNATLMLALPQRQRGAILGFVTAASTGGSALSAVLYGFLGEVFPLYAVFIAGSAIALGPTLWLWLRREVRDFILTN